MSDLYHPPVLSCCGGLDAPGFPEHTDSCHAVASVRWLAANPQPDPESNVPPHVVTDADHLRVERWLRNLLNESVDLNVYLLERVVRAEGGTRPAVTIPAEMLRTNQPDPMHTLRWERP